MAPWWLFFNSLAEAANKPVVRYGLREERLALSPSGLRDGTLFFETDTGLIYQSRAGTWYYASGVYPLPQADIEAFRDTLLDTEEGLLIESTDYFHQYRWDGAALDFAPGDPGSAYVVIGQVDGSAPNGGLWEPCSGAAVDVALPDGTIDSINTQVLNTDTAIIGAAVASGPAVGERPTWESGATTDDESSHTHTVHVIGSNSYDSGAFNAVPDQTVGSSGGSAHHHDLSDSNAQLKITGDGGSGMPPRVSVVFYMRR